MSITWFNDQPKNLVATLHENHITLNKEATRFFENAYMVMLGIDNDNKAVIIKPLAKELAIKNAISDDKKYKITVRNSYSRVTNKAFIKEITNIFKLDLELKTLKYNCYFDESNNLLTINLKEALK